MVFLINSCTELITVFGGLEVCSFFIIFGTLCYIGLCRRCPRVKTTSGSYSAELVRFCKWSAVLDRLRTTFADIHPFFRQTLDLLNITTE